VNKHEHVNPYIAGSPVTGTQMFYGREDVFSFIRRNLIGQHRDSPVVLYGQRRTGKTSVLYQLHRHLDPGYRCIFIDLHGLSLDGMGNLLHGVANSISRDLRREHGLEVQVPDRSLFLADPQSAFETVFLDEAWSVLGEDHLVLMMDEVVRIYEEVRQGRLEREIFDFVRHLMQHYDRLNFVFSLGSGLEEMAKDYAFLFSVSLYHRISFLELAAARDLIIVPVRDRYQVAPQAVTSILQITSGHPYYTQLVCHCMFDSWSRAPKPVMDATDVDAILPEAIELGSANLTYVYEDSTPEEQALMAGIAAAPGRGPGPVTIDQILDTWRTVGVSLPEREVARALRSLISRDVLAGDRAYSFTVDLQRLWLKKHRRLDWVKDELADSIQEWNRSAEPWPADAIPVQADGAVPGSATDSREPDRASAGARPRIARRRYLAIGAAAVLLAGYLAVTAAARVFPFSAPAPGLPQSLVQLLPADLEENPQDCHNAPPPGPWTMPGKVQTVHCTDSGLPGGNVYAFQLDSVADFQTAWRNFNRWWGFLPASAGKTCPPKGTAEGIVSLGSALLPQTDRPLTECGMMKGSTNNTVPAFVQDYPTNDAFVIAEGAPSPSFSALVSWLTMPVSPAPSGSSSVNWSVTATGLFDRAPNVSIPKAKPGSNLAVRTLIQGTGSTLTRSDTVAANFVLYFWNGTTTSLKANTFTSNPTLIGGTMLPGLETALIGKKVGSRVLAVIPPAEGYGTSGDSQLGITGSTTLVFVIDVLKAYSDTASASGTQVSNGGGTLPTVSAKPGSAPALTFPSSAPPSGLVTKTLVKGNGPKVVKGQYVIAQYTGYIWRTEKVFGSSWSSGSLFGFVIGASPEQVIAGWDKGLVGQTVGSRVMLVIPPSEGYGSSGASQAGIGGTDTLVFVVDIIDAIQPGSSS
jgi:FKBP-type peptidyl-prolyl cis-trans isomerase